MKRFASRLFSAAAVGIGLFGLASAAQARSDVYFSVGVGGVPVYAEPAPVVVQPAPVYVEPARTYAYPRPVYVQPSRVYVEPDYSFEEERAWRRHQWRRHHWRHHHDWDD